MTMKTDAPPRRRRWPDLPATCAVVAVVMGFGQAPLWNWFFGAAEAGGCPGWICGQTNSPVIDGAATATSEPLGVATRSFHELNLHGLPNAAGFAVAGIRKGDTPYEIEVQGAAVSAQPLGRRGPRLTGATLVGLVIDLRDENGARYALKFAGAGTTTHWVGTFSPVSTYRLTYTTNAEVSKPLCTAANNEAILFAGDRYDSARKTVTATGAAAEGWVNVACASTALAKLFLLRHTQASQLVPTTAEERQAMLKMLTADVCGDGHSFTVHGQPLYWADAKRITRFPDAPWRLEAVWNEHGAVCMEQPRRPELTAAIEERCGPLPRCTSSSHGSVISANPTLISKGLRS